MPGYIGNLTGENAEFIGGKPVASAVGNSSGSILQWDSSQWNDSSRAFGIGTTQTIGVLLENATPAALNAQQRSPALAIAGNGWATGGSSQDCRFLFDVLPVQGATPYPLLQIGSQINGGSVTTYISVYGDNGYTSFAGPIGSSYIASPSASYMLVQGNANQSTGLGTAQHVVAVDDTPLILLNQGRTAGAGNVAIASCYDAGTSTLNAGMILHTFGWTNDSNAWQECISVKPLALRFVGNFAVAGAPTGQEGDLAYCTNGDTGAKCLAFFDGSNWLRISLGATIAAS